MKQGMISGNACVVWIGVDGGSVVEGKNWLDPNFPQAEDHPVVCISWNDASAYIDWLGRTTGKPYRFLSESEWEYMARRRNHDALFLRGQRGRDLRVTRTFPTCPPNRPPRGRTGST